MDIANAETIWREVDGLRYAPAPDALGREAPMPYTRRYPVLGIPLLFATNAPAIAEAADAVFGDWDTCDADFVGEVVGLRVFLQETPQGLDAPFPPLLCRVQSDYLMLSQGGNIGFADRNWGFAAAFVTPEMVRDTARLKTNFLECPGLYLVSRFRPATLHAAAVALGDRCLLLTGESGAGKSTLAYACLRAGFRLLAEDIVFVNPSRLPLTVWGNPWHLHLLPDTERLFPELAFAERFVQMNGEKKRRVTVNGVCPGAAVTHLPVWGVCSLQRVRKAETRLCPADPETIERALTRFHGDPPLNRAAITEAVQTLLSGRLAHLQIGGHPDEAAQILRAWLETAA